MSMVVHFERPEHQLLKTYEVVESILILEIKFSVNGSVFGRKIIFLHVMRRRRKLLQQRLLLRYMNKTHKPGVSITLDLNVTMLYIHN
jgi:hypothetical protein